MTARSSTASSNAMFDSHSSISQIKIKIKILILTHLDSSLTFSLTWRHFSATTSISKKRIITYSTDMSFIEYLNTHFSTSKIMICKFSFKQIFCYSSKIISNSWTIRSEKFYLIIAIFMSIKLITTAKEKCLKISWKRSVLMSNTISTESKIKLNKSSIIIAIHLKIFSSENISYTTLFRSKCQSSSSSKRWSLLSHIYIRSKRILRMSEKMLNINRSINQLINQLIRSIRLVNQLIKHQLFKHHSDKHFFNQSILNCYTIYSTSQLISFIISIINHFTNRSISMHQSISTCFSNYRDHHTSLIKFDLLRKHLNRIYLNQLNHLYRNYFNHLHLNHFYFRSHQHLNSL
jgi:hypothetical protein